jgi:hypothetical protein
MLKGLKGILEKGLQIAAPLIGNAILPGGLGAAAGSGIASLLGGAKPQEALLQAGVAGILGKQFAPGVQDPGKVIREGNEMIYRAPKENIFSKIGSSLMKDGKPTTLGTGLAVGLPAILAGMGAAADARKAQPMDPANYMSAVDKEYGGQFASPPANRRIMNLDPVNRAEGGIMDSMPNEEISYSATDGGDMGGLMTMADGGQTFPRKTGMINGPGGPKEDKIPAMLSDGEFVFTAKAVNNAGGPKAMYNMMNKLDPESEKPN